MGQVHSKRIAGNYVEYQDHEKRLIDDWLRREFKDNAALTATR